MASAISSMLVSVSRSAGLQSGLGRILHGGRAVLAGQGHHAQGATLRVRRTPGFLFDAVDVLAHGADVGAGGVGGAEGPRCSERCAAGRSCSSMRWKPGRCAGGRAGAAPWQVHDPRAAHATGRVPCGPAISVERRSRPLPPQCIIEAYGALAGTVVAEGLEAQLSQAGCASANMTATCRFVGALDSRVRPALLQRST